MITLMFIRTKKKILIENVDRPTYIDIDNYKILINKLVDMISKYPSVVSIFQVGSIKNQVFQT